VIQKSTSLKYEPASEPLHNWLILGTKLDYWRAYLGSRGENQQLFWAAVERIWHM